MAQYELMRSGSDQKPLASEDASQLQLSASRRVMSEMQSSQFTIHTKLRSFFVYIW